MASRRILLLLASANSTGNTAKLADAFMAGAIAGGHEVKKIFAGDNLHCCRGCGACQVSGKGCVIHDVMDEVYPLSDWCDTIVIASPLFFWSVSAQAKAFIDRLYAIGREDRYPRRSMGLLMSAGDDNPETFAQAEKYFRALSLVYGEQDPFFYFAGGCDGDPGHHRIAEAHLEGCRKCAMNLD